MLDMLLTLIFKFQVSVADFLHSSCAWQDFLSHATDGLFTQGGFNDRTQDLPSTQNHYGLGGLQSQVGVSVVILHGICHFMYVNFSRAIFVSLHFEDGPFIATLYLQK